MGYDQVISLGAWCQTREQIRRQGLPWVMSPFDRLGTPFWSLCEVLKDSGARLSLACTSEIDCTSPKCAHYALHYHHEYWHDGNGKVVFDAMRMLQVRKRLLNRFAVMDRACQRGGKTLFIRMGGAVPVMLPNPYIEDPLAFPPSEMANLIGLLEARYPALDFDVLFVTIDGLTHVEPGPIPARAIHYVLPMPPEGTGWQGCDADWAEMFRAINAAPRLAMAV